MKTWLRRISIFFLALIVFFTVISEIDPYETIRCSICSMGKTHAPCLLNLSTGEITELALYQPHFSKSGEISDTQYGGTFNFIYAAGLYGYKLTDPWHIEIAVPLKGDRKNEIHYCENCQKMLGEFDQGFALIDLYDVENPIPYELVDGVTYTVRCYQIGVSVEWEEQQLLIYIDGLLQEMYSTSVEE